MALASPFFGKRDPEPAPPTSPSYGGGSTGLRGTTNATRPESNSNNSASLQPKTGLNSEATPSASTAHEGGSRLIVGPNIKLKGVEITDCDTLVVEGTVEATMDSRVIQIAATGAFKGSADIDIAEIHGQFEGNLTVRQKLVIYAQGKVNGTIRYGKVVIEEGGQLSGDVQFGTASTKSSVTTASTTAPTALQVHTSNALTSKQGIQVAA